MNIIEVINGEGVKTTSKNLAHFRFQNPKPGDVIDFGDNENNYPFTHGRYGRIDAVEPASNNFLGKGECHICCGGASVFLCNNGSVSISGGPFETVKNEDLEPTFMLKTVRFWNWGDNLPGGGMEVDYYIQRPVFKLKKQNSN